MKLPNEKRVYERLFGLRVPPLLRQLAARWRLRAIGPRRASKAEGPTRAKQADI